jgi:hypothetical protein
LILWHGLAGLTRLAGSKVRATKPKQSKLLKKKNFFSRPSTMDPIQTGNEILSKNALILL